MDNTKDPNTLTGPFLTSQALGEGWVSRKQLYSPLFTKLFHGVHMPAATPITHELRCRAAALVAPDEAVLTGASAAVVRGFEVVGTDHPVEFVVPEHARFRAHAGINIRRTSDAAIDSRSWESVRLAGELRMAMDMLTNTRLHSSLARAVGMLDVLLRAGAVEACALRRLLHNRTDHGIVRARHALELADARAESIPESEMRVLLVLGGLSPTPQYVVHDESGTFLGRLDLAIEQCRLGIEYDGAWHNDPAQAERDNRRRDALREAGWEVVVVRSADLYGDPRGMVRDACTAINRSEISCENPEFVEP